jgi:hypothetical protein
LPNSFPIILGWAIDGGFAIFFLTQSILRAKMASRTSRQFGAHAIPPIIKMLKVEIALQDVLLIMDKV